MAHLPNTGVPGVHSADDVESGIINSPEGESTRADDRLLPVKTDVGFLVNLVSTCRIGINDIG